MTAQGTSFALSFSAAVYYRALSFLDLDADASSIYCGEQRAWSKEMTGLYPREPRSAERLQILPLITRDIDAIVQLLHGADSFSRKLAEVLVAEAESMRDTWLRDRTETESRLNEAATTLAAPLEAVRRALYSNVNRAPAPLLVLHAPALANHGRAARWEGLQRIAVSFDRPLDQAFCQIVHEEAHSISDPEVLREWQGAPRSTSRSGPGYDLHVALERRAIELGQQVIEAAAPELSDAYGRWRGKPF